MRAASDSIVPEASSSPLDARFPTHPVPRPFQVGRPGNVVRPAREGHRGVA